MLEFRNTFSKRVPAMWNLRHWSRYRLVAAGLTLGSLVAGITASQATVRAAANSQAPTTAPASDEIDRAPADKLKSAPGQVFAEDFQLQARVDGVVKSIVKEGQSVKKGDLLVMFEHAKADAALQEAQAKLDTVRAQFELQKERLKVNNIDHPDEAFILAKGAFEEAEAHVAMRKAELVDFRLISPVTGVVSEVMTPEGHVVKKAYPLLTIVVTDGLKISFEVPASAIHTAYVCEPIHFAAYDEQGHLSRPFTGRIYFIAPAIGTGDSSASAKATVNDPDHKLRPGMLGKVTWLK